MVWDSSGAFHVYGLNGKLLGTYTVSWNGSGTPTVTNVSKWGYFKGKTIGGAQDRLGSMRAAGWMLPASYRSYGAASTGSGFNMFATYPELGGGMYYADQRMYNPLMGKFFSPDETKVATASFQNPISWNMYAYALGDPVNRNDPKGKLATALDCISNPDDPACNSPCQPQPALLAGGGFIDTDPDPTPCPTDATPVPLPAAAPAPAPPPPAPLECEAAMYTRPVDNPFAKLAGATHSYWDILEVDPNAGNAGTPDLNEVISGDKTPAPLNPVNPFNWLNVNIHAPTNSTPGAPYSGNDTTSNPASSVSFDSGLSTANCMAITYMYTLATKWPQNTVPYNIFTSNSNTVAHLLGSAGGFSVQRPAGAFGWGWW